MTKKEVKEVLEMVEANYQNYLKQGKPYNSVNRDYENQIKKYKQMLAE